MLHLADRFPAAGLSAPVGTRARSDLYRWLGDLSTAVQPTYTRWFDPARFTTDPDGAAASGPRRRRALRRHVE